MRFMAILRRHVGLYEGVAFVTGFVLMAFELVASRLLAPTIGTSIYVWTSIIGVMIGALAIGYAAGGWVADRRSEKVDIAWLLLGTALAIVSACMLYRPVLTTATMLLHDVRLQGVVASVVLFMPTSFLLGMCGPYLAKLRVRSVGTTGRSVAGLSAANSLGGIAGTFCAGFLLFAVIGSRETLAVLASVLVICSWLVVPRASWRFRMGLSVLVLLLALQQVVFRIQFREYITADIDTPAAHYQIIDRRINGRPAREFITGPGGFQSGIFTDGSSDLVFPYTRKLADLVAAAPKKYHILILGGGAFTLPTYLARSYPRAQVDVVEIDPRLVTIATQYFGYRPMPNLRIFAQDARTYLANTTTQYDLAIIDAYNNDAVPFALTTHEYVQALQHALRPDGTVAANIVASTSPACMPLLASLQQSYTSGFDHWRFYPLGDAAASFDQNIIAVYSNANLAWADHVVGGQNLHLASGKVLTDDYAPVELLQQHCSIT